MTNDIPRCKTCKHWAQQRGWDKEKRDNVGKMLTIQECLRIPQYWDIKFLVEDDLEVAPDPPGTLAFAKDGEMYSAYLVTLPDFGCVMHEAIDP